MASRGRRTGVAVSDDVAKSSSNNRMEDAEALFNSAESPPQGNETIQAAAKPRKAKEQVRFSLAEEIVDHEDTYTNLNAQHPTRRSVKLNAGRQRASVDTNELSSVSTAVLSVPETAEDSSHRSPLSGPQLMDDPDRDPDDELIPPPPDDESSDSKSESGSEPREMVATQREQDEQDFLADDNHPGDEDFPAAEEHYDENDDDNEEGTGFHIPGGRMDDNEESEEEQDPETPEVLREQRRRKAKRAEKLAAARKKKDASVKSKKKKTNSKDAARESSDDSGDGAEVTPSVTKPAPKKKKPNPYATTFESKGRPLPLTFTEIPISNLIQSPPEDGNIRRSKRARTKPLEYWRGEKYEWGANDFEQDDDHAFEGVTNMPVPIKVVQAEPTPYKKRKVSSSVPKKKKGGKKSDEASDVAAQEPFDASRLPYPINEGKVAHIWDERYNDTRSIKVVSYLASMEPRTLPLSKSRRKSEGKAVGLAAQSFAMPNDDDPVLPGYIVGSLTLPPKAIKDEESVHLCAQIFTVVSGQPKALEIAYSDNTSPIREHDAVERFLLSEGDNVLVPPGNSYRLKNHSKSTEAILSWTVIRHNANAAIAERSP